MPFPYSGPAASARPRRLRDKEKDIRYRSNSTSSRRSKELPPLADSKSMPRQAIQPSVYAHENMILDQLPPLPLSRTTSSGSAKSPVLHAGQTTIKPIEIPHQPYHFHTPASLRPYLEEDTDPNETPDQPLAKDQYGDEPYGQMPKGQQDADPWSTHEKGSEPESTANPVSAIPLSGLAFPPSTPYSALPSYPLTSTEPFPTGSRNINSGYSANPSESIQSVPWHAAYPNQRSFASPYAPSRHLPMLSFSSHTAEPRTAPAQLVPYLPARGYLSTMPTTTNPTSPPAHYRQCQESSAHDTLTSFGSDNGTSQFGRTTNIISPECDSLDMLHRIQCAIPDLYLLMDRYRETFERLESRENSIRQIEVQKDEAVRQSEIYIKQLATEMSCELQKHIKERGSLQLEIDGLEKKLKDCQESLILTLESTKEVEAASEKRKIRAQREFGLREQAMKEDLQAKTWAEAAARKELSETKVRHMEDVEEKQHLKVALETCQQSLALATQQARESQEKWNQERKELVKDWDEKRSSLLLKHEKEMEVVQRDGASLQRENRRLVDEELTRLRRQMESTRLSNLGRDADKVKLAKIKDESTALTAKEGSENARLLQVVDTSSESTKLRGKGDTYFKFKIERGNPFVEFMASALTGGARVGGVVDVLPEQVLKTIPSILPNFYSGTKKSLRLRASYVQHIISRAIHQKIFRPFFFTLVCNQRTTNQFLGDMSDLLKHKSIRRKSSRRQQTLHAAYKVRTARQAVNEVAEDVVKDIMGEMRYFVPDGGDEMVQDSLRRIVKTATETWRYARLEKEPVTACMSPDIHPVIRRTEQTPKGALISREQSAQASKHVLDTFPLIRKAPKEQSMDLLMTSGSCIYSSRFALCADSPIILGRLAEIQQDTLHAKIDTSAEGSDLKAIPLVSAGDTCKDVQAVVVKPSLSTANRASKRACAFRV
ncbi:hypothetical protein MMC13_007956 [Lambiella insularis]|nr:hypothetical protein [Lambiella insularis]